MKTLALLVTSLLFAVFGFTSPARAATVITAGTDAELRAAVAACGTITFNFSGTITLTSTIPVTCAVMIDATGHAVTISGGNSNRVFNVLPGGSLELVGLTIANGRVMGTQPSESVVGGGIYVTEGALSARSCTFTNCSLEAGSGGNANGGAIAALSSIVNLSNCFFKGNVLTGDARGGAIYALGGVLTMTNCQFIGNKSSVQGGALYIGGITNTTTIYQSVFEENSAERIGGAVSMDAGTLDIKLSAFHRNSVVNNTGFHSFGGAMTMNAGTATLEDCDFFQNQTYGRNGYMDAIGRGVSGTEGRGGALAHLGGSISFSRSTFRQNLAQGGNGVIPGMFGSWPAFAYGGAIYDEGGSCKLTNCTLALNRTVAGTAIGSYGLSWGGAIASGTVVLGSSGALTINACTIASNRVSSYPTYPSKGGGLFASGGSITMLNTLFQGNAVNASASSNFYGGTITDLGHNLSSDDTLAWSSATSLSNLDSLLLPLANNGGPTLTMSLRVGSPALNNANPGNFPATDQRGIARPQGTGSDIGAWEGVGGQITLSIFRENSSTNRITWLSDTGLTYRVEGATVLNAWSTLATGVPGNGATVEYRTTNSGLRYFRVATEP